MEAGRMDREQQLQRLGEIFRAIDAIYGAAMRHYRFSCEGCDDNCCVTKFHHHTLIEELYLAEGLALLDEQKRQELLSRAGDVTKIHRASPEDVRVMCPLNDGGLCIVYEHRPLICRIHGVPYEMHKQNMSIDYGIGCHRFMAEKVEEGLKYFPLNRTMFYVEIAKVEKEARALLGYTGDYRKTTAEMVLSILLAP
ncbi:MAG: YkgJ family cysteine cluster protein [Nitrospirota bacterium]